MLFEDLVAINFKLCHLFVSGLDLAQSSILLFLAVEHIIINNFRFLQKWITHVIDFQSSINVEGFYHFSTLFYTTQIPSIRFPKNFYDLEALRSLMVKDTRPCVLIDDLMESWLLEQEGGKLWDLW
jgi:hypothetical protein